MVVDYVRVTPDEAQTCPDDDVEPPATTAALDPAEPGAGGTYDGPVDVTLSATDGADANASGVDRTEYRVDDGEWQQSENGGGADPFTTAVTVSAAGEHTVRYRSHDAAGNLEASQEVEFTIEGSGGGDTTAPATTAALDPETPGPGGTYDGPVGVTLTATDPDDGGPAPEPQTHDVAAQGTVWAPADVDAATGDEVTWHFDEPAASFPHDVWLVPPGGNPDPSGGDMVQVTNGIVLPGGPPVSQTFAQAGSWSFLCRVHASFSGGQWSGMTGTVDVAEPRRRRGNALWRRLHRVPGEHRRRDRRVGPERQQRGRRSVRDLVHGLRARVAHGRVPLDRRGRQRRGHEVGGVLDRR